MGRFLLRIGLLLCQMTGCAIVLWVHPVLAQDLIQQAPAVSADTSAKLREILPSIVYTLDKDGKPVAWVDSFPWALYEKFAAGIKDLHNTPVVISELALSGRAETDYATIRNVLKLKTLRKGQHFVPIRMGRCHFTTQPKITGESDGATVVARFDESQNGYELVVRAKADQVLTIEFETTVMLKRIGDQTILRMSLPRSSVSSVRLEIAESNVVGRVVDGRTVSPSESLAEDESRVDTVFEINGLVPNFEFWWQPKQKIDVEESFGVVGDIDVSIDSLGEVTSVATLNINSFNSTPVDGFVVALPENTRWADSSESFSTDEYSISPVENDGDLELLQVVFAEPAIKPPPVRIVVEAVQNAEQTDAMEFQIAGFDVRNAASQYGQLHVFSEGAWTLDFQRGSFARQTTSASRQGEKTFDYSRPNQVSMVVTKQTSELTVEPIYVVTLEETVVRLTAIFQCTQRGGRLGNLSIEMGDWIFQSLGPDPDNVVSDTQNLLTPTNGRLDVPLSAASDRFEVIMMASLPIENGLVTIENRPVSTAEDKSGNEVKKKSHTALDLDFPFPLETKTLLQSTVALLNDNTIVAATRNTPQFSEVSVPDRLRAEIQLEQIPQCFRMRAIADKPAMLPIAAARLARLISVDITTEILGIDSERIRIRQQMQWQVKGVPVTRAFLSVNADVLDFGDLEVQVDGQSVVPQPFSYLGDFASENESIQVPIEPGQPGTFEITVTYDWANWNSGEVRPWQELSEVDIDLILPQKPGNRREDRLMLRNDFRTPRVAGYNVRLHQYRNFGMNMPWHDSGDPDLEASSDDNFNVLPIDIQQVTTDSQPKQFDELVDRAWFQTWYTDNQRSDRAVFRVQGGDEDLQISIADSVRNKLTVWVDGQVTEFRPSGEKLIEIAVDASKSSHVVELHYSTAREPIGSLETSLPRIAGAEIMGQWYWHIVMPRNECMVTWPRNLTRAHHWDWSAIVPRRESEMTIVELERWSGAMPSGGKVLAGSSQYLFGAMGEPNDRLSVRTAPLPVYVLAIAGAVLIAGLLLIYTKRPTLVLIALGITILALIFLNPTYASIAGQIAAFGIVLVLLGQLLSWLVDHSPRPRLVATSSPSTWIRRMDQSSEPAGRRNAVDEPSTTLAGGGSSKFRSAQ